jgi:hypothetical protein
VHNLSRIPTEWSLEKDSKGRWVAEPAVTQVASPKVTKIDGWELRRRFLRLKPGDRADALQLLQDVGVWIVYPDQAASMKDGNKLVNGVFGGRLVNGRALPVALEELWRVQQEWIEVLRNPRMLKERFAPPPGPDAKSSEKLAFGLQNRMMNDFPLRFEWRRGRAFGVVETISGREMVLATTHMDLLRHAEFKDCARKDCAIPFPRISDHDQIYCSPDCAHVMAQRALRERRKKEKEFS